MKKYLDKTDAEKVADDIKSLTEWYEQCGVQSLIELVAKRHAFINTRCLTYRKALVAAGLMDSTVPEKELVTPILDK